MTFEFSSLKHSNSLLLGNSPKWHMRCYSTIEEQQVLGLAYIKFSVVTFSRNITDGLSTKKTQLFGYQKKMGMNS